jgi:chromosome segregation ATPase
MFATPPKHDFYDGQDEEENFMPAGTPAPHRARVNNLTNQVSELVRSNQHLEKRHKADLSRFNNEMDQMKKEMDKYKTEAKQRERELVRCKAEGDGMREEVSYYQPWNVSS